MNPSATLLVMVDKVGTVQHGRFAVGCGSSDEVKTELSSKCLAQRGAIVTKAGAFWMYGCEAGKF